LWWPGGLFCRLLAKTSGTTLAYDSNIPIRFMPFVGWMFPETLICEVDTDAKDSGQRLLAG
jgi:hypothetical protein